MNIVNQLMRRLFPARALTQTWQRRALSDINLLSIDLELTSLDPRAAAILSFGWVPGRLNGIRLEGCQHHVVTSRAALGQSPVIHGLTKSDVQQGESLREVLQLLLSFADDHLWIFHNAELDMAAIRRAAHLLSVDLPPIVTFDTMRLQLYQLRKSSSVPEQGSARLAEACRAHKLPEFAAHNALDDAMATMLLCLAQLYELDPCGQMPLKDLTHTGALKMY